MKRQLTIASPGHRARVERNEQRVQQALDTFKEILSPHGELVTLEYINWRRCGAVLTMSDATRFVAKSWANELGFDAETTTLRVLADVQIPVPRLLAAEQDRRCVLLEHVATMDLEERLRQDTPQRKYQRLVEACHILTRIHGVLAQRPKALRRLHRKYRRQLRPAKKIGRGGVNRRTACIQREVLPAVLGFASVDPSGGTAEHLARLVPEILRPLRGEKPYLTVPDVWRRNVVVDDRGAMHFIDFEIIHPVCAESHFLSLVADLHVEADVDLHRLPFRQLAEEFYEDREWEISREQWLRRLDAHVLERYWLGNGLLIARRLNTRPEELDEIRMHYMGRPLAQFAQMVKNYLTLGAFSDASPVDEFMQILRKEAWPALQDVACAGKDGC